MLPSPLHGIWPKLPLTLTALYAEMKENVLLSEKEYASKPLRDHLKGTK